ncbi:Myosin heavy chain kinase C [Symbiodinium microadriaticum]|uniref:Myosin heavy chain kinase C n=1 Tax=Symbiodinium microadriaticum TaxID=2951 RepID=A0A1Q9DM77_SYMMI|nr:Myosin heavy chain kinase C [Symbiodinium microadriaticum]
MDVIHQTFAKHYAELFNQEVHRRSLDSAPGRCGAHDVDFLLTHVVELPEKSTYSAEAFMLGEYRKHNTNGGFTMGPRQTPQSFSCPAGSNFANSGDMDLRANQWYYWWLRPLESTCRHLSQAEHQSAVQLGEFPQEST